MKGASLWYNMRMHFHLTWVLILRTAPLEVLTSGGLVHKPAPGNNTSCKGQFGMSSGNTSLLSVSAWYTMDLRQYQPCTNFISVSMLFKSLPHSSHKLALDPIPGPDVYQSLLKHTHPSLVWKKQEPRRRLVYLEVNTRATLVPTLDNKVMRDFTRILGAFMASLGLTSKVPKRVLFRLNPSSPPPFQLSIPNFPPQTSFHLWEETMHPCSSIWVFDPISEWHMEYYFLYMWWMDMSHRNACI
jgi:hypothetical protein